MIFKTRLLAERWLSIEGYWHRLGDPVWHHPTQHDHVVVLGEGPDGRWYCDEHLKD